MPTPLQTRRTTLIAASVAALCALPWATVQAGTGPRPVTLANVYRDGVPLADYRVSEKYDGVRAYWDGRALYTRHGHRIHAPAWFTAGWPGRPLDGELWAGHGRYTAAASAAARDVPDDTAWRTLRYMVFDLPGHTGPFDQRLQAYTTLLAGLPASIAPVPHHTITDPQALQRVLRATVRAGGEGLMLRRGSAPYRSGRSDDLLKLKEHLDAEATVIGHLPGKGRHEGRLGALLVSTPEGLRFRLGTGFTDRERETPPSIGSRVTYRYSSQHPDGTPRFAHFLRVRAD